MRSRHAKRSQAGVLLVTGFVLLMVAAAGASPHPLRSVPPADTVAPDAAHLYSTYCAACHGANAKGDGPAAVALKVMPPDLTRIAARNGGRFPAERVRQIVLGQGPAAHGDRTMPVWGDVLARKEAGSDPQALVDALVKYLDGLQERRSE